jgi:hypothetical protein
MECAVAAAQGCGADRLQPSGAERVAVTFAALLKGALALFHAFHNALSSLLFCSLNKTQTLLFVPLQAPLSGSSQALCETLWAQIRQLAGLFHSFATRSPSRSQCGFTPRRRACWSSYV